MDGSYVFVIGAGASKEVNLPIGEELKTDICKLLNFTFEGYEHKTGDSVIVDSLRKLTQHEPNNKRLEQYVDNGRHICRALPQALSIDNFIDQHRGNADIELLGKLAITKAILLAESKSKLAYKKKLNSIIDFRELEGTWYTSFFKLITENCVIDDLKKRFKKITLVIFNYDRCIEHYLLHALRNFYDIDEKSAAEIVGYLNIFHPYGKVGDLPWKNTSNAIGFGELPDSAELMELSKQIRTFTESIDSAQDASIKRNIAEADKVVFLGFAFNRKNMELLTPTSIDRSQIFGKQYFASTLGISQSGVALLQQQIKALFGVHLEFRPHTAKCSEVLKEFWLNLSY